MGHGKTASGDLNVTITFPGGPTGKSDEVLKGLASKILAKGTK